MDDTRSGGLWGSKAGAPPVYVRGTARPFHHVETGMCSVSSEIFANGEGNLLEIHTNHVGWEL